MLTNLIEAIDELERSIENGDDPDAIRNAGDEAYRRADALLKIDGMIKPIIGPAMGIDDECSQDIEKFCGELMLQINRLRKLYDTADDCARELEAEQRAEDNMARELSCPRMTGRI